MLQSLLYLKATPALFRWFVVFSILLVPASLSSGAHAQESQSFVEHIKAPLFVAVSSGQIFEEFDTEKNGDSDELRALSNALFYKLALRYSAMVSRHSFHFFASYYTIPSARGPPVNI